MLTVDVKYISKVFFEANVPLVLWGDKGIGKSSIIKQLAEELKVPFVDLRLATQEVSDLIGIPKVDIKTKKTYWAAPEWFPDADQPEGILFLDEMNRAQRDVIQGVFQLVLDKRLHTHILPPGWRIFSACNYAGLYDVRELDEAMMSRFGHVDVEASHHAVCDYGTEQSWSPRVISFLRSNPTLLMATHEEKGEDAPDKYIATPDPRRWEMCSNLILKGFQILPQTRRSHLERLTLQCLIGEAAARAFLQFKDELPTFEEILEGKANYKEIKKLVGDNLADLNTQVEKVCYEIVATLKSRDFNPKELDRFLKFIQDINRKELVTGIIQRLLEIGDEKGFKDNTWVEKVIDSPTVQAMYEDMIDKKFHKKGQEPPNKK